jgi:hypothetical protein
MLTAEFMSYFVDCLRHDEHHLADSGGYRVFLSPELGVSAMLISLTTPQFYLFLYMLR